MRSNLFFALELPAEVRDAAHAEAQRWRASLASSGDVRAARWYAPEDYHLTLKFLGAREPCEIDAFAGQVGSIVAAGWRRAHLGWIDVRIDGAGAFPSLSAPRVLWAGGRQAPRLAELVAQIEERSEALGIAKEGRAYQPHVTLARMAESKAQGFDLALPPSLLRQVPAFCATRFVLMQTSPPDSRKSERKLRYNIVRTFDIVADVLEESQAGS